MKTALVTGGSRGIGSAIVRLLADKGFKVAFTYNNAEDAAKNLCRETGAVCFKANFENADDTRAAVKNICNALGDIDLIVNNAGICSFGVFNNITESEWARVMNVNLNAAYRVIQEALPFMLSKKDGCIINISSIWGVAGSSCEVAYSVSKAGLIGLTKALAKELSPSNIRVNCVCPGVIDTDMNKMLDDGTIDELKAETPLGRLGKAEEIAQAVYALYENKFITGQILTVDGGFIL